MLQGGDLVSLCALFMFKSMLWGRQRGKMFPSTYLLPVDAIIQIPQMWPKGWLGCPGDGHRGDREPDRVLAHSVTPTVPTYRQLDIKW